MRRNSGRISSRPAARQTVFQLAADRCGQLAILGVEERPAPLEAGFGLAADLPVGVAEMIVDGGVERSPAARLSALDRLLPVWIFLAIGLGMHLHFESSENDEGTGLSIFTGQVRRIRAKRSPHIGWNDVEPIGRDTLLREPFTACFQHSAAAVPADDAQVVAWTRCYDLRLPAAVRRDNVWGLQFHPEKSGVAGLRLIRDFVAAARAA